MKSILYYIVCIILTIIYFVLFSTLFALTVCFDRERVVMHYASIVWGRGMYLLCPWWKVRFTGRENIDRKQAYVIVCNHQSMLDIPLMYFLPLSFKWVSKKEIYKIPIFGWVLWMHGDIAIERGASSSAKKLISEGKERIKAGTSVIIFPEGTRTPDGRVHRFKEGAFSLAKNAGAPILPCVLEGTGNIMDGWKLKMPHLFTVRALEPIAAEQVAALSARELTEMTHNRILATHQELRKDLYK